MLYSDRTRTCPDSVTVTDCYGKVTKECRNQEYDDRACAYEQDISVTCPIKEFMLKEYSDYAEKIKELNGGKLSL